MIEDPQNALPQNSTPQLPPQPGKGPFDHQLPVDSKDHDNAHQLAKAKLVGSEEEAWARGQTSKKSEGALRGIKRLNTIIFKSGIPNVESPDAELVAQFCGIRDSIFGLVHAQYKIVGRDFVEWLER